MDLTLVSVGFFLGAVFGGPFGVFLVGVTAVIHIEIDVLCATGHPL